MCNDVDVITLDNVRLLMTCFDLLNWNVIRSGPSLNILCLLNHLMPIPHIFLYTLHFPPVYSDCEQRGFVLIPLLIFLLFSTIAMGSHPDMKVTKTIILSLPLIMDKLEFFSLLMERFSECSNTCSDDDTTEQFEYSDGTYSSSINPVQIRYLCFTF